VTASDGVRIPVSVVARADLVEMGTGRRAPGSGALPVRALTATAATRSRSIRRSRRSGFRYSNEASSSRIATSGRWRDGSHLVRDGKLAQKPRPFSDFVAVARDLIRRGWTTSEHLAIRGGRRWTSHGGRHEPGARPLSLRGGDVPFVDAYDDARRDLPLTVVSGRSGATPTRARRPIAR